MLAKLCILCQQQSKQHIQQCTIKDTFITEFFKHQLYPQLHHLKEIRKYIRNNNITATLSPNKNIHKHHLLTFKFPPKLNRKDHRLWDIRRVNAIPFYLPLYSTALRTVSCSPLQLENPAILHHSTILKHSGIKCKLTRNPFIPSMLYVHPRFSKLPHNYLLQVWRLLLSRLIPVEKRWWLKNEWL